jgi:hypothetical protein
MRNPMEGRVAWSALRNGSDGEALLIASVGPGQAAVSKKVGGFIKPALRNFGMAAFGEKGRLREAL